VRQARLVRTAAAVADERRTKVSSETAAAGRRINVSGETADMARGHRRYASISDCNTKRK